MEWTDVSKRIEAGEDHATEFNSEFGTHRSARLALGKAICAFANGPGGLIVLGVDESGSIVGLNEDPDEVHERLAAFLQNGCSAPVCARYGRTVVANGWVHWIEVPRVQGLKPLQCDGRVYVRREQKSVEPSSGELQELFSAFGFFLNAEQVIAGAGVRDIDLDSFKSFRHAQGLDIETETRASVEDDLLNAGVVGEYFGELRPTLYGLMTFGRNPQAHLQTGNCLIRCAVYAGTDRGADVVFAADGNGRLDQQVRRTLDRIRSLGRNERHSGHFREDRPLVPEPALREALVNAIVHRDYAITGSPVLLEVFNDRAVVTSPGTLPNRMTLQSVRAGGHPRLRNEIMAHAMTVAGLAEMRGRGWPTMRRAMREFNGTEPELANDEGSKSVRVTFRLEPEHA